jgi:methylthioribulose-1-phosphate dehydratase
MEQTVDREARREDALADELIAAGRFFHSRGWVPATGGNFSASLSAGQVLITASGVHKGELRREDFVVIDLDGRPQCADARKTSYETGLHLQLYRFDPHIGAVLHVHSVANTILSRQAGRLLLQGYELQKILPGNPDPELAVEVPIFNNDQNIVRLSELVEKHMRVRSIPAYLVAGHGLYAWGHNLAQARHRVEALEFMFECELRRQRI